MFSQFKSFFMANIPNNSPSNSSIASTIFLSEKDLAAAALKSMDCNFLRETLVSRPTLDFPESSCQMVTSSSSRKESDHHEGRPQEGDNNGKVFEKHQQDNRYEVLVSSLKVKLPNSTVNKEDKEAEEEEEEEGCRTPTSPEYKIPAACPPAPRKPKPMPAKRRGCHKRVFLDLSDETESLFPPLLLADLGKKIKKIRSNITNPIL